jgi:hydroxyacylglutathione hydrolase
MVRLTQHTIKTPYLVGPIHCYTGVFDGDLVLFDTGPPTTEARKYLQTHINLKSLKHVIVTHCHIDHYGQASWLEENSDATIYLPYRDCLKITEHDRRMSEMYRLLSGLGFDQEYLDGLRRIFDSGSLVPPFPKYFKVTEENLPKHLGITVLPCPGHSQSDLVFVGEDWAVTGDTLLKGVFQSPLLDVDLEVGGRFKNYEAYCSTIVKLSGLKDTMVLPAHRQPISNIDATLLFYISKLLQRAGQLHPCQGEENLMVLIDKLLDGRRQDILHSYFKASEILFMKDFLNQPELLRRSLERIHLFEEVSELYDAALSGGPQ